MFGDAKMKAQIDFLAVLFDVFFECVFASILGRFFFGGSEPEKSIKTIDFSMVFINFQKNAKKLRFWRSFRRPKP